MWTGRRVVGAVKWYRRSCGIPDIGTGFQFETTDTLASFLKQVEA
jgi:hypothetical protein